MKKPFGWRREPARHALAAKGVETKVEKSVSSRPLALPPKAMRSGTPAIRDDQKEVAIDTVMAAALAEGGDKNGAVELLEDDRWLESEAKKVANAQCEGFMQRAALKQEIVRSIRRNPPQSEHQEE